MAMENSLAMENPLFIGYFISHWDLHLQGVFLAMSWTPNGWLLDRGDIDA